MKQVPCYQKTFEDLHQRSEGDFAIYEREELGTELGNGHRFLDQQRIGCKFVLLEQVLLSINTITCIYSYKQYRKLIL